MNQAERKLKKALTELLLGLDSRARIESDPIRFPKRYHEIDDQELVALLSASLSYGRVSAIGKTIESILPHLGEHPAQSARHDALLIEAGHEAPRRFKGFVYRFTREPDLERLWKAAGRILLKYPHLGDCLRAHDDPSSPHLLVAYQGFYDEMIAETARFQESKGFHHLFSNPRRGSALKRINMWLRWLVRGPDQIDLGLWSDLGAERLIIPLDVHIYKLSHALGLSTRKSADLKTAMEITYRLQRLAPKDPIQFDFALAHLGISGQCRGYRIEEICSYCPLKQICTL